MWVKEITLYNGDKHKAAMPDVYPPEWDAETLARETVIVMQEGIINRFEDILIYVRDNHLCGTPLKIAIDEMVDTKNKKTTITHAHPSDN